ncbi:MAG TPA: response regulator [Bacteroidetes bacterium]|nr:response regulator [Bacteroidota bacterium]
MTNFQFTKDKPMKLLIVDDSPVVRARLIVMLQDLDHITIVGQAGSVEEAQTTFRRATPDVVVLDIRMPGGSGIDVLKMIKAHRPETKVIMLTNYPYAQYQEKCKAEGADYFFDKSVEFEKVVELVRSMELTA